MNNKKKISFQIIKSNKLVFFGGYLTYQLLMLIIIGSGLAIREIFARYSDVGDETIWKFIILFIVILLGRVIAVFVYSVIDAVTNFYSENTIRSIVLSDITNSGASNLLKPKGYILNSIRVDVFQLANYIQKRYIEVPSIVIFSIVALAILIATNWQLLLLTFPPMLVVLYMIRRAGKHIAVYHSRNRKFSGKVATNISEVMENVESIKLNSKSDSILKHFDELNLKREKHSIKDTILTEVLNTLYSNIVMIGIGLSLLSVSLLFNSSNFDLSEFTMFIYYMSFISSSFEIVGSYFVRERKAEISLSNIKELGNIMSIGEDKAMEPKTISRSNVELNDFTTLEYKCLKSDVKNNNSFIRDVRFKLNKGEILAITGRVGSGKSTLVKSILGLIQESHGSIIVDDSEIISCNEFVDSGVIAYCPQKPHFFSATVKENITLGRELSDDKILDAIKKAELYADLSQFSEGVHHEIGSNGMLLSGGQRQRLSLARMLVSDADILVVDDLSSSLDVNTSTNIRKNLFSQEHKTIILTSTKREELELADKVLVLKGGAIDSYGRFDELLETSQELNKIINEEKVG